MKKLLSLASLAGLFIGLTVSSCGGENKKTPDEKTTSSIIETGIEVPYLEMIDSNLLDSLTKVKIETSAGNLVVALYNQTPLHRDNFIKLAQNNFYNNTLFHRVIKGFMIQGGDPESKNAPAQVQLGGGGPGYKIPHEIKPNLYHIKGALAAARQGGLDMNGQEINPNMESSGSQFYIVTGQKRTETDWENMSKQYAYETFIANPNNQEYKLRLQACGQNGDQVGMQAVMDEVDALVKPIKDSILATFSSDYKNVYASLGGAPDLDKKYTVFGYLLSGYETLSAIENAATDPANRPTKDVKILKCTIINP